MGSSLFCFTLGAAPRKMPVQRRQHPQVLRAACGLLGPDHISEVGDDDLDLAHADAMSVYGKLRVATGKAGRMEGDVKLAIRADQIPHLGGRQRGGIMAERQPVGLRFRPDARAQVAVTKLGDPSQARGSAGGAGSWIRW